MSKRIAVLGLGYVGIVTSLTLAHLGHHVTGFDVDRNKVEMLSSGNVPIFEEGLDELLHEGLSAGRVTFVHQAEAAIAGAEFVFICVGTPSLPDGRADLSQVRNAAHLIGRHIGGRVIVVNKSTVPVGTADMIEAWVNEACMRRYEVHVVSNPEFLREGTAVRDALRPDRIVIGAESAPAGRAVAALFQSLEAPVLYYSRRTAEMVKYASNAFLATKISFINEIAAICERVGADVVDVAEGMGYDPRIGPHFLRAGAGYGGSCFPKDTAALIQIAGNVYYDFKLLKAVVDVNHQARMRIVQMLEGALNGLQCKTIAVLGLSFKPHTDDIRESPALTIIPSLLERGASVRATDPAAVERAVRWFEDTFSGELSTRASRSGLEVGSGGTCLFTENVDAAVSGADAVVLLTEWPQFLELDWRRVAGLMAGDILVDARNALPRDAVVHAGLQYMCVGRPNRNAVHEGVR